MAVRRLVEVGALLAGLVIYFMAEGARDEVTVYPARCVTPLADGSCRQLLPLSRTVYRASPDTGTVVYWSRDIADATPAKLSDCAILDSTNWTCQRSTALLRMREGIGSRGDFGLEPGVVFVRWWHWQTARISNGYALPLVPRQFE